jgi:hypothetical protein
VITGWPVPIAATFAAEVPQLTPLPHEPCDAAMLLEARVDTRARVWVRQRYYLYRSVMPGGVCRFVCPRQESRSSTGRAWWPGTSGRPGKYVEVLTLDHYLEVLEMKPGATALVRAKACGAFTLMHQRYWDAARRERGDAAGTRALIEVLVSAVISRPGKP